MRNPQNRGGHTVNSAGTDVVGALCARDYKGIGAQYVSEGKVICTVLKVRQGKDGGGKGPLIGEDVSFTLATRQDQTLFEPNDNQYIVRRLTPLECERLQGFPDGWTDIQYRGKPAPDTARYKALGNSMAVPVIAWIGKRIEIVDEILRNENAEME